MKKTLDGLSYRQAQRRNSQLFSQLSKAEQRELRAKGYRNKGWGQVQKSWYLLGEYIKTGRNPKVLKLAEFAVRNAEKRYQEAKASGDLLAVLQAGEDLIKALELKYR
ncbi:MAG: hypothetical protein NZL92_02930 [Gloeomargarita sp. SKYG116]|nr:hypothetical protein [Gloeomargarita sp. SKYG116]MCS7226175.1 hypothetical protein [Gloeomargarita sp. SKYB31]MDW8400634.1 hypothetical protein [Gloeomargarita sp. SKYGB_i_bin116]